VLPHLFEFQIVYYGNTNNSVKMKQYILLLFCPLILSACNNSDSSSEKIKADVKDSIQSNKDSSRKQYAKKEVIKLPDGYEYFYTFSNNSISEKLYIKKGLLNKKLEVPENLKFKLIFENQNDIASGISLSGVAILGSPNESFGDKNDLSMGDYEAADYRYKRKDYELTITIDVNRFEASVLSLWPSDSTNFGKKYKPFFPEEFNRTNVLKREN
jgi:hypothetical protein